MIMSEIVPRQEPVVSKMQQRIKLLHDNYILMFSKYELILELGRYRETILGESSLYKFIFYSFFRDVILAITRLFENYENNKTETVHLLSVLKMHKQNLEQRNIAGSIKEQAYKNKLKDYKYHNSKVKDFYYEHIQIFEFRNRILAHSQFLYDHEIKDLNKKMKSDDIKEAIDLAATVIKYLVDYYEIDNLRINTEIISSAKHDIGLLTRVLEEEAEFLRIQFEEYQVERNSIKW
jgi:hypothetical protein